MTDISYDNPYQPDNVYGHALDLIGRNIGKDKGVHLDLGCGFGAIAEKIRSETGLEYIGVDMNVPGLVSLKERGFESLYADFRDVPGTIAAIDALLQGRPVVSASLLDTAEHLESPEKALAIARHFCQSANAPLICSTPNAAHRDIGAKLVFGRLDYTVEGLLDHTHLHFFTEDSLTRKMRACGWHESDRMDVRMVSSDQHFPATHPLVSTSTVIGEMLGRIVAEANPNATTNQFVRCYLIGPVIENEIVDHLKNPTKRPFLTVLTRTQARRPDTLRETLLCLSAQTCLDYEVLIVGHKVSDEAGLSIERIIEDQHEDMRRRIRFLKLDHGNRTAPLNFGFEHARGDYVAILDDDDLVFAHWVEELKSLAKASPGRILRVTPVAQTSMYVDSRSSDCRATFAIDAPQRKFPDRFDALEHHMENRTPPVALAFPRSAFSDLAIRFDERLTTTEDWDYLMRVANLTGVASSPEICAIYRMWKGAESSYTVHSSEEWQRNHYDIWRKLDEQPLLLPAGSLSRIRELMRARYEIGSDVGQRPNAPLPDSFENAQLEAMRQKVHLMITSNSWALTRPLRWFSAALGGGRIPQPPLWHMDFEALNDLHDRIANTWSWRLTTPLRRARNLL